MSQASDVHVLSVHTMAVETIQRCGTRVDDLLGHFGAGSPYYRDAEVSLRRNLAALFSTFFGHTSTISRDGDLSLYVQTASGFVFGMIFHPIRRGCTQDGCKALINDDGTTWTWQPRDTMCDSHVPSYPLQAPTPGTWSFHS